MVLEPKHAILLIAPQRHSKTETLHRWSTSYRLRLVEGDKVGEPFVYVRPARATDTVKEYILQVSDTYAVRIFDVPGEIVGARDFPGRSEDEAGQLVEEYRMKLHDLGDSNRRQSLRVEQPESDSGENRWVRSTVVIGRTYEKLVPYLLATPPPTP